jgi:hypothetical protein
MAPSCNADVFRPAAAGRYPVIMNFGFYGESFELDIPSPAGHQRQSVATAAGDSAVKDRLYALARK